MYNDKVMEIFRNPQNVGKLSGANAVGKVGNMQCGDIMKIYMKINDNQVIEDASFETFGCAAAIVSSSLATTLVKGKTVEQALALTNDEILKEVGELPVHKIHCSVLATEAIADAIKNYRKRLEKEKANPKAKEVAKTKPVKEKKVKETKVKKEEKVEQPKEVANEQANDNQQENLSKLRFLTSKIVRTTTTTTTTPKN